MSKKLEFRAVIQQTGKTTTGIVVPPTIVEGLEGGKKPKVVVWLNDFSYRTSIAMMGGDFMISVSSDVRASSGLKAGDEVLVRVSIDTVERIVEVPEDFQKLLDANSAAKEAFEKLSYSNKRRHTLSIDGAKTEETRQRRLHKAIGELSG